MVGKNALGLQSLAYAKRMARFSTEGTESSEFTDYWGDHTVDAQCEVRVTDRRCMAPVVGAADTSVPLTADLYVQPFSVTWERTDQGTAVVTDRVATNGVLSYRWNYDSSSSFLAPRGVLDVAEQEARDDVERTYGYFNAKVVYIAFDASVHPFTTQAAFAPGTPQFDAMGHEIPFRQTYEAV